MITVEIQGDALLLVSNLTYRIVGESNWFETINLCSAAYVLQGNSPSDGFVGSQLVPANGQDLESL